MTTLRHYNAEQAGPIVDRLIDIYLEVYGDADPAFFNQDRYRRQLGGHMTRPAWELVTAEVEEDVVGYIYGFALPEGTRWWRGLLTAVPDGFTTETGRRTLAISELMVREPWRRRGVAKTLHDDLLAGRSEERATLLVEPDNTSAQAAYRSWGWQKVAELRPGWEHAPLYDVLIYPLRSGATGQPTRVRDPLAADDVRARLTDRPGWAGDTTGIDKTFSVNHGNIPKIFADVWHAADDLEHHPDIDVRWDTIRFAITTHSAGDVVTELDFLLADRIDQIAAQHGATSAS